MAVSRFSKLARFVWRRRGIKRGMMACGVSNINDGAHQATAASIGIRARAAHRACASLWRSGARAFRAHAAASAPAARGGGSGGVGISNGIAGGVPLNIGINAISRSRSIACARIARHGVWRSARNNIARGGARHIRGGGIRRRRGINRQQRVIMPRYRAGAAWQIIMAFIWRLSRSA